MADTGKPGIMNETEQFNYWKEDARKFFMQSDGKFPEQLGSWPYGMVETLIEFAAQYTCYRKKEEIR